MATNVLDDLDLQGAMALLRPLLDATNAPAVTGQFGYNSGTNRVRYYNGAASKDLVESGGIVNADVNAAAAIAYSKLALAASIQVSDLASQSSSGVASSIAVWSASGLLSTATAPAAANDLANKSYVDSAAANAAAGKSYHKNPVVAATDAALPTYTAAGSGAGKTLTATANGAFPAVDGVTLALNDRVAVLNPASTSDGSTVAGGAATAKDAGVYTLTQVGDGTHPWILTRATDFDGSANGQVTTGTFFLVDSGTVWKDTGILMNAAIVNGSITVGGTWAQNDTITATINGSGVTYTAGAAPTTATVASGLAAAWNADATGKTLAYASATGSVVTFNQLTDVAAYTLAASKVSTSGTATASGANLASADPGLAISPDQAALTFIPFTRVESIVAGTGLTKTGNTMSISNSGVTAGTYIGFAVNAQGQITGVTLPTTLAGFGITDGLKKQWFNITGDGTTTAFNLTHNLGTRDVETVIRAAQTPFDYPVLTVQDPGTNGTNVVQVVFKTAPAVGVNYRALIAG